MNRLRDRYLPPGRGRVYLAADRLRLRWSADYRTPGGMVFGVACDSPAQAFDWIRGVANAVR